MTATNMFLDVSQPLSSNYMILNHYKLSPESPNIISMEEVKFPHHHEVRILMLFPLLLLTIFTCRKELYSRVRCINEQG